MGVVALVVLAGRGRDSRDPGLLWAAAGLLVAVAAAMALQASAFVVFSDDGGPLRTTSDGRALLFLILHLTVYLAAFAAWRRWGGAARAVFVVVGLVVLVAVAADRGDPRPGRALRRRDAAAATLLQGVTVAIGVLALAAWISSQPRTSALHGWVAVAMMFSVFELLLTMLAVGRYNRPGGRAPCCAPRCSPPWPSAWSSRCCGRPGGWRRTPTPSSRGASPSCATACLGVTQILLDGARRLGRATTTHQVADVVAGLVREVSGVDLVVVVNDDPEVGRLRVEASRGLDDVDGAELAGSRQPAGTGGMRRARCRHPRVRVDVVAAWIRRFGDVRLVSLPGGPWAAVALLPLRVGEVALGFVVAGSTRPRVGRPCARRPLRGGRPVGAGSVARAALRPRASAPPSCSSATCCRPSCPAHRRRACRAHAPGRAADARGRRLVRRARGRRPPRRRRHRRRHGQGHPRRRRHGSVAAVGAGARVGRPRTRSGGGRPRRGGRRCSTAASPP